MAEREDAEEWHRVPDTGPRRLPRHLRRRPPPGAGAGLRWDGEHPPGPAEDGGSDDEVRS